VKDLATESGANAHGRRLKMKRETIGGYIRLDPKIKGKSWGISGRCFNECIKP